MSFNMRHTTKKGRTPFKSKRHGKTRRVQRGGVLRAVMDGTGNYDDESGLGTANYPGVGQYVGHFLHGVPNGQGTLTYNNGDVYEGDWANDEKHGRGKIKYADGGVYEGDWVHDKMQGQGIYALAPLPDDPSFVAVYEGELVNDQFTGQGTMRYKNGSVYVGTWADDNKNGQGTMRYDDGSVYEGSWANDKRHGLVGTMRYADGSVYEGNWDNNQKNGHGTLKDDTGSTIYVGSWKDDQMNGNGTYTLYDGDVYVGNLVNDVFAGQGTMNYANGNVYVGAWADDNKNGHGKMSYANGDVYEGMWDANFMHGRGKMTYPDSSVYEGPWNHGNKHGENGRMRYADGRVYEGEWWNDTMHGDGTLTSADGSTIYEGLWRVGHQNQLFNPGTGELADNVDYNNTLQIRPPKIFPISDNMLYQSDTYEYYDLLELQIRNVLEALREDPDAIALKVNRTYYVASIHDIERVANDKNYIQYECPVLVDLNVNQPDLAQVIKAEPYLSINGMGVQLGGVVPLFDIWSAIKTGHRAFELVGTRRVLLSTASHHVMFNYGSLVSSNHCQSGIPATVYELQRLRIAINPRIKTKSHHANRFVIKNKGTKKLNRYIRGVGKQSHARTQSRVPF